MKAFCMLGLISGVGLCIFDWVTSIQGFKQLMSGGEAEEVRGRESYLHNGETAPRLLARV